MKKTTKLLSVILAFVMALSCMTMMASAYTVEYKTHEAILAQNGYNNIDTVTRLPIDMRADMICDWLDELLAGININVDLSVVGKLDARSIDSALTSICGIKDGAIFGIAGGLGMLGDVKNLSTDSISTYRRTSDSTGSQYVLYSLFGFLNDNRGILQKVVDGSISWGNILKQVISPYKKYLDDIPGLIAGLIAPLFERKDDNSATIASLIAASNMDNIVRDFVIGLFSKPQSTTTVKADRNGNMTSGHNLPTQSDGLRYYYVISGDKKTISCYVYDKALNDGSYIKEEDFVLKQETVGSDTYVYAKADGSTLKYYAPDSYWLPSLATSGQAATIADITSNKPAKMLYDMIPYVFKELAVVVLNGSAKKLLGELFGATYNKVGEIGSAEVQALADYTNIDFFKTKCGQNNYGKYVWEFSDYYVAPSGNHYYRFEDEIYAADLTNVNEFFNIVNYDYKITGDFLNDFIPTLDASTGAVTANSKAGYSTVLQGANDFIGKVYNACVDKNYLGYNWQSGANNKIVDNIRGAFTAILNLGEDSGEKIFQELYDQNLADIITDSSASNKKVVAVLAAFAAKSLMKQLRLPAYANINSMLEVGAVVVRELATQLLPGNDFDNLIYSNYNNVTLRSHTDDEWIDIILTMGTQIGIYYLNSIADLDCTDPALGGFVETKVWNDADLTKSGFPTWEATVDFIIDWALDDDNGATGAWKMRNLVKSNNLTINRATIEDPWVKLDSIVTSILPIQEVLNITVAAPYDTVLEQALRGNFVNAILNLDVEKIVSMFNIPTSSFLRTQSVESALFYVIRSLINNIGKFGDDTKSDVVASSYNSINSVLSKSGLSGLLGTLLPRLSECSHQLVDTFVPILNFFIGWSVDDQVFKAASVSAPRYTYNADSVGTFPSWNTITVKNNANGMERQYKNGNSYAYDTNYQIEITEATASVSGISVALPAAKIKAGETVNLALSGSYSTAQPIMYTIKYKVYDAQGEAMNNGKVYTDYAYSYLATTDSDEYTKLPKHEAGNGWDRLEHDKYIFTQDIYTTVKNYSTSFQFTYVVSDGSYTAVASDRAVASNGSAYFRHATLNQIKAEAGSKVSKCNTILSIAGMGTPASMSLFYVKDGVTAEDIPYGYYDLGKVAVKVKRTASEKSATDEGFFVYYTDYGLADLISECLGSGITKDRISTTTANSAWNEYQAALLEATSIMNRPYVATTMVSDWMPLAEASVARLQAAYEAIQEHFAGADITPLETVYEATKDVNFQNVMFYRYAKYETAQRAADKIFEGQREPAAPEKYIDGHDFSAAKIDEIVAAESSAFIKSLINNTVTTPEDDRDPNWKAAPLMDYDIAIAAENLQLTYNRLIYKTTNKTFLNKDIAAAASYQQSLYTEASWNNFQAKLADAVAVKNNANATQQEVFDAKYYLLEAENRLILKTESSKLLNKYAPLEAAIARATSMLENHDLYTLANGSTDAQEILDAWTSVFTSLGYVSAQGDYMYKGSAIDYTTTDRRYNAKVDWDVAAKLANLNAAMAKFECAIKLVANENDGKPTEVLQDTLKINGITPATIASAAELKSLVKLNVPAAIAAQTTYEVETVKANQFGTGTKINVKYNNETVLTYEVVIYGDVNGDGVVDAFDALAIDLNKEGTKTLTGAYLEAADANHTGSATDSYEYVKAAVVNGNTSVIAQVA